jgi:hypothetical protein
MAWAAKNSSTQLTSITTEQFFDDLVTLNPREAAHCQVDVNFPATPTDNAIVSVYTTLDASSENWDDTPIAQFVVDKGTDPNAVSFTIIGVYKFRVGVKRSGSTDTIASADFAFRTDGVSL